MTKPTRGVRWLLSTLETELDDVAATVAERIRTEIPEYAGLKEVRDNASQHLRTFLRWAKDGGDLADELGFEREITTARLEAGFQLLPTLGAYRIGEIELWEWLLHAVQQPLARAGLDAVSEVSGLWFEYDQHARNVTIASYVARDRRRAVVEAADRRNLLEDLIQGRVSGSEAERRLRQLGCEIGKHCSVVVISLPSSPLTTAQERTQTLAVRLQSTLEAAVGLRPFVALTQSQVTAVVPWNTSPDKIEEAVHAAISADHVRVRAAVSLPVTHIGDIRPAYRQAMLALDMSTTERPITALDRFSAFDFLIETAPSDVLRFAPAAVRRELTQQDVYAGELIDTISVYMQSGMRAREAAERLHIHTNTIYYRLTRIEQLFGIDSHDYWQLLDLFIHARILRRSGAPRR